MNSTDGQKKSRRLPIIIGALTAIAALITVLAAVLSGCGGDPGTQYSGTEQTTETLQSEPDKETAIWSSTMSGSGMTFELRVNPGVNYKLEQQENYNCTLVAEDGKTVKIDLSGLIYETDLERLILFFKQKNPEKVLLGKESETIIAVYGPTETEAVFKLSGKDCLTVLGTDIETIRDMLKNVTIKTGENYYTVPDSNEEFENR